MHSTVRFPDYLAQHFLPSPNKRCASLERKLNHFIFIEFSGLNMITNSSKDCSDLWKYHFRRDIRKRFDDLRPSSFYVFQLPEIIFQKAGKKLRKFFFEIPAQLALAPDGLHFGQNRKQRF